MRRAKGKPARRRGLLPWRTRRSASPARSSSSPAGRTGWCRRRTPSAWRAASPGRSSSWSARTAGTMRTTVRTVTAAARRTGWPGISDYREHTEEEQMRKLLTAIAAAAFALAAHAQQFPTKRVSFVSGVTPGSASDTMARILAEKLQAKWGQPVIVENRLGAGGLVGAKYVADSAPDGHLIMMYASAYTVSTLLNANAMK